MNVLELYSGTQSIGKQFRLNGHNVLSVELDEKFLSEPFNLEQWTISVADVTAKEVEKRFNGKVDIVWASPLCTTCSIAAISTHRELVLGFGSTVKEVKDTNSLIAKSDMAKLHDQLLLKTLMLIQELKPKYYFIENPRGGMRKNLLMRGLMYRHTLTYCSYGDTRMKPTDLWTNHPNSNFKSVCHNGNKNCHHEEAPRGSKTGTQGLKDATMRSIIPEKLCKHIVFLSEN